MLKISLGVLLLVWPATAGAQTTFTVSTETELRSAITAAASGDRIILTGDVTLTTGDLPSVHSDITVDGGGHTLSGNNQFRGLMVIAFGGATAPFQVPVAVTIQNLTIANTLAQGGAGGSGTSGGGGGGGLGGALFVASQANVTLSNVNLVSNRAAGGSGGAMTASLGAGGGGGGLGGNGGDGASGVGGGGGGVGSGAAGGSIASGGLGGAGILVGATSGGSSGATPGGVQGGGGTTSGQGAGGGGQSGGGGGSGTAGDGGFGGGGGGAISVFGSGTGGMGGGGGGGTNGFGGYGAGSGGDNAAAGPIAGGFGGGSGGGGAAAGGGGGGGMGGGIFVDTGGQISISGPISVNGNTVAGGAGADGGGIGAAYGAGLFLGGFGSITFSSTAGETQTVGDMIGDELGSSGAVTAAVARVIKTGAGTLVLSGANQYNGGTVVEDGTLRVASAGSLGIGGVTLHNASTLAISGSGALMQNVTIAGTPVVSVAAGQSAAFNGAVADDTDVGSGSLTISGGGALTLGNATNSYSGGTTVNGNSTLIVGADGALGAPGTGVTLGDAAGSGTLGFTSGATLTTTRAFTIGAGGAIVDTAAAAAVTIAGSVSGAGSFTKTGTGALTLAGVNDYTGGTVVGNGVLRAGIANGFGGGAMQIAAPGTLDLNGFGQAVGSLAGAGAVTLGAGTLTAGSDNSSTLFSGTISGTGGLVKSGSGVLALTGTNTYGGGTIVSGGTLAGTTDSLQGTIQNNAAVIFDQNAAGTYAGVMSGGGSLTKSGAGVVTLTGANTYSGGTLVSAGALAGTTSSLQGNITNDAAVQFDQAANGTYAGTMTGIGALVKSGSGILTLTGTNTYSGGTTISGGTLVGDTQAVQGNILNNAQLVFNQTTDGTYAGSMAGSGGFTKTGPATLTLTAQSAYSGGTTVSAGTLAGSTFSLQGAIQNNASLRFDQAFDGIFNGGMTGAGSLNKSGIGLVVLNGTNTYSGGTTVSAGALAGTTASLQGAILNNARVIFDQGTSGTYSGVMSGSGALAKTGVGTLTLLGINSYAGGTTIAGGGAIAVAVDAALGAASGSIALGDAASSGTLTFTNGGLFSSARGFSLGAGGSIFNTTAATVALSGAITGAGGLTKTGGGVLVLSGANTYAGATLVSGGILRTGASNTLGSGSALLVGAGAAVDLNGFSQSIGSIGGSGNILLGSGTLTTGSDGTGSLFAGAISGSGGLVKTGGGTLVLTGANSYSGGTTLSSGALVGNTTSLQGNIVNGGTVQFDQGADGSYTGSMTGSGALAKTGAGVLTLTGTNTYSGGTQINGGSVIGTASSLRGLIVNNGQLTFGGGSDGVFGGTLAGTGSLLKTGSGMLTLNGAQPGSGLFTVSQGTLSLNGLFGGSLDVSAGATLRARGVIAGSLNLAGSLFVLPPLSGPALQGTAAAPGDAIEGPAYLTIGRDFTAANGSLLDFAIGPGATPTILVGGTAGLNGARFSVTAPSIGTARSVSFLALAAANGLSLTNSSVTTPDAGVIPVLKTDRNSLFVTLLNLNVPLRIVAAPGVAAIADALDRTKFNATGDAGFVIRELTALDDRALGDALEQLGGQLHASVLHTAILDSESVTDLVRDQLSAREMEDGNDVRWWAETACQSANFKPTSTARGGQANVCAGAGGADKRLSERWTVGGGGSYTDGRMGLGSVGSGDYTAPRAFGYAGYKPRTIGFRGGGSAAKSSYQTVRQIAFRALLPAELGGQPFSEGIERTAESEQQGATKDSWGEIHDSRKIRSYTFEGLVGIRHARVSRGSFAETGAIAVSLNGEDETVKLTQTDVRIHGFRRSGTFRPFFDLNYRRELAEGQTETQVEFAGLPSSDFIIQGINIPANSYSSRMGVTFATRIGQATVTYEYKQAPGQRRQTAGLRFRFK